MNDGARIRAARLAARMTQEELARRSGVRQPNIAAYESGKRAPSRRMLARLLAATIPRPSLVLGQHRDEVLRVAAANRARDVRVFGSIARGQDTADSDIDLIVSFEEGADIFDQGGLLCDLEDLLGRHVDVVSDRALTDRDALILQEAVPL